MIEKKNELTRIYIFFLSQCLSQSIKTRFDMKFKNEENQITTAVQYILNSNKNSLKKKNVPKHWVRLKTRLNVPTTI